MDESGIQSSPPWRQVPPLVLDVVLAVAVVAAGLIMVTRPGTAEGRPMTWQDALVAVIAFGLVFVRRRWPLPLLAVLTALVIAVAGSANDPAGFVAVTVVAAYTVAAQTNRRSAWLASGTAAAVGYVGTVAFTDQVWLGPPLGVVALIGMATAIGDATRNRRAYVASVRERARRAEQTREEEARRRIAEERMRIARDLHDVVAHHIAVINVHAGLAEHTVRTRTEQAEASLGHVRQAAQTVLGELTTILSVLRQNGDADAPTEPVRSLSQLGELLDTVAAAGLRVEHRQVGPERPLPAAIDQAAYRIVQEALTNAHKHGIGHLANLRIEYRANAVVLDVDNPAAPPITPSGETGHGLIGMRERVHAVGGTIAAGPAGDRFHVHAVLPMAAQPESRL
ncbi:histidine kinase [Nonomuraea antimicrobica]|uniref:histidine kinase n=2 Tax=Nonomuraea antimicrobica TaxID=561173 RepID=A0ABP7CYT4_9ACTN